jgi:hypothetical protein
VHLKDNELTKSCIKFLESHRTWKQFVLPLRAQMLHYGASPSSRMRPVIAFIFRGISESQLTLWIDTQNSLKLYLENSAKGVTLPTQFLTSQESLL